jgi:prolyl 4-hydroxylase
MKEVFLVGAVLVVLTCIFILLSRSFGRGFTHEDAPWEHPQVVKSVLTPEECQYIIDKAEPMFARSTVVGVEGGDASRTSQTAWIPKTDPVAQKVFTKALEFTGKTMDECENLQVVKYEPGTFYREHHDSCCDGTQGCIDFEKEGGQRVATLLVYLNSDFTDGETHFPNLDLKLKADPGSAILFRPLGSEEAKCHPKALHAGLPISSGVKYVCNAWVRENKFR